MFRTTSLTAAALALTAPSAHALLQPGATLVESTFDGGAEGWTGLTTSGSPGWSVDSANLAVNAAGGAITLADPDTGWTYFSAPAAFLGDLSAVLGGVLRFDSRWVVAGTSYANEAEVVLKGAGLVLTHEATNALTDQWTTFAVPLAAGAWRVGDSFSGLLASDGQVAAVLADLDALWINAEHFTPVTETIALDNVRLITAVPEPGTWLMLLAGLGVLGGLARHRA